MAFKKEIIGEGRKPKPPWAARWLAWLMRWIAGLMRWIAARLRRLVTMGLSDD